MSIKSVFPSLENEAQIRFQRCTFRGPKGTFFVYPFQVQFLSQVGFQRAPKWEPKWGPKSRPRMACKSFGESSGVWALQATAFDPIWSVVDPFDEQFLTNFGSTCHQEAITNRSLMFIWTKNIHASSREDLGVFQIHGKARWRNTRACALDN